MSNEFSNLILFSSVHSL